MRIPVLIRAGVFAACLCVPILHTMASGTTILMARYRGEWMPVVQVRDNVPFVDTASGPAAASPEQYSLRELDPAPKGLPPPVVVDVRDLTVKLSAMKFADSVQSINHELDLRATITAPLDLPHVFIVMEFRGEDRGVKLLVHEVGDLRAGLPDVFEYRGRLDAALGKVSYAAHLYSNGFELIPAQMGQAAIDEEICRRIRAEVQGVREAKPRPYVLMPPAIPDSVRAGGVRRFVPVSTLIRADGRVAEANAGPDIARDLAEAAEGALRKSYFLPKVVDGKPVDCRLTIQVALDPSRGR